MRIRHFGFLANRCRAERLGQIRQAITDHAQGQAAGAATGNARAPAGDEPRRCPRCRTGRLRMIGTLMARPRARAPASG
jgi:hypothetical protein